MKRVAILMAVLALAAGCDDDSPTQPSNTGPIVFSAPLSAANEVPPVTNAESTARGTTTITFDVPRDTSGAITGGGNATFGIQLTGFPSTSTAVIAAHIHPGAAGVNGSPLVALTCISGRADRPDQRCRQCEHHRPHHAGGCDEHHRGAGEFLFQRAHTAEWRWRGARAARKTVGIRQRPTANSNDQGTPNAQLPSTLCEEAGLWELGVGSALELGVSVVEPVPPYRGTLRS